MSASHSEQPGGPHGSPWRGIFEKVRGAAAGRRDEHGVAGSINWLRKQMALNGANPNVVRNIIYRDKGRVGDKRVLFDILNGLWEGAGNPALQVPELEVLLSAGAAAEQEIAQLLGRDKRRAYRAFVSGVRAKEQPKLLVTGRPGSGKTVLIDFVQQALELPPKAEERIIRLEFSNPDLGASLARLADALGIAEALYEAKLVKIGLSSAFAVQADAQADVARLLIEGMRRLSEQGGSGQGGSGQEGGMTLLLHISRSLAGQDSLGAAQLRLNTEEVPRVTAAEWLWLSLLEPMSKLPRVSLLVTMADAPLRVVHNLGAFEGPLKLSPPTQSEAKRFVRSKLPHLSVKLQDDIAKQAGRSFEDLRILTLLAEVREPKPKSTLEGSEESLEERLEGLSSLVDTAEDTGLRDFLSALAVLSLPDSPHVSSGALEALGQASWQEPSSLARAFLDAAPTMTGETQWRPFSRQLGRALRGRLAAKDPGRYRQLHLKASLFYEPEALAQPGGEAATRYLQHLFEARDWQGLQRWMEQHSARQSLIRQIWQAARREIRGAELETVARQVARYYVRLASYDHPEAQAAFELLALSPDAEVRAWTQLKRAEGAIYKGRYERAEALLEAWPEVGDPTLRADFELARANVARWRGELVRAARYISEGAQPLLGPSGAHEDGARALVRAKVAVWSGLIAKDQGRLEEALAHFGQVESDDGLVRARQAFQKGDVQARLGRFDAAVQELSLAVHLAEDCEAPVQERARYLARRARVLRKQGELGEAAADFGGSLELLGRRGERGGLSELELAFERAKVHDERALNLLALGHYDEAVLQLQDNLLT
ncbi:MAG: hypothetical protein M3498_10830, partial [Deinococcota bacterium]|nr:hypothetical protein [Deinococcota bacterium]